MAAHRQYDKISEVKRRITEVYDQEDDYIEVARLLGAKRTSAHSLVQRFQQNQVVALLSGGARRVKMEDDMRDCLIDITERNPAFTLKQINEEMRILLPEKPNISIATVAKVLDGQLKTIKKLNDAPVDRNSEATKNSRKE